MLKYGFWVLLGKVIQSVRPAQVEWSLFLDLQASVEMSFMLCLSLFYVKATTSSCCTTTVSCCTTTVIWFVVLIKLQTLESHFTCISYFIELHFVRGTMFCSYLLTVNAVSLFYMLHSSSKLHATGNYFHRRNEELLKLTCLVIWFHVYSLCIVSVDHPTFYILIRVVSQCAICLE